MFAKNLIRASTPVRSFSFSFIASQNTTVADASVFEAKEIISGAPKELTTDRVVRIFKEAKPATQSGHHNGAYWKLDWDVLGKSNRWENDLMGYQGSADYMQGTIMKFDTKEAAINFAEGQGWSYYLQEPKKRHFRKKEYAMNFQHSAGPLKHIRTK